MTIKKFHKELLQTDAFAQYSLRSSFFVRKLRSFQLHERIQHVHELIKVKSSFDWSDPEIIGIETDAWERISQKKIDPLLIFCHPRVLTEQPQLLLYYRTVALLSQKGLSTLVGGNISKTEAGKNNNPDSEWITKVAVAVNSVLSAVILTAANISDQDLSGFQFATLGATIQGSWNNAIGLEGEAAIKTILINNLQEEIKQIVWRDGSPEDYATETHSRLLDKISDIRVLRLKQGYRLLFSSEPDVSLRDPKDLPIVAIEVKAGADPAGALERLGAAMKSFENERNLNPRVKTIYVVRALTNEVQKRISQSKPFDYTFGLSDLLADKKTQQIFSNLLMRTVLGK